MPNPISENVLRDAIERGVKEVFRTMLHLAPEAVAGETPLPTDQPWARPDDLNGRIAAGNVGFAGEITGLVYLYVGEQMAHRVAGTMLGMSPAEVAEAGTEVVSDAVGELSNMVVGVFKNQLVDMGYPCKLTIPTVVWGQGVSMQPMRGTVRRTYVFRAEGHSVVADLVFKHD